MIMTESIIRLLVAVPTEAVGYLIGKAGKTLNELADNSNCRLYLQGHHDISVGAKERAIIIEGSVSNALEALHRLFLKLSLRNNKSASDVELVKWSIPQSMCGILIGRGGEGIKHIHAETGSWVKVAHIEEALPGDSERLVYIRGTKQQNENAVEMIKKLVGGRPFIDLDSQEENSNYVQFEFPVGCVTKLPHHMKLDLINELCLIDPKYDVIHHSFIPFSVSKSELSVMSELKASSARNMADSTLSPIFCAKFFASFTDITTLLMTAVPNLHHGLNLRDYLYEEHKVVIFVSRPQLKFSLSQPSLCKITFICPESAFTVAFKTLLDQMNTFNIPLDTLFPLLPMQKGPDKNKAKDMGAMGYSPFVESAVYHQNGNGSVDQSHNRTQLTKYPLYILPGSQYNPEMQNDYYYNQNQQPLYYMPNIPNMGVYSPVMMPSYSSSNYGSARQQQQVYAYGSGNVNTSSSRGSSLDTHPKSAMVVPRHSQYPVHHRLDNNGIDKLQQSMGKLAVSAGPAAPSSVASRNYKQ